MRQLKLLSLSLLVLQLSACGGDPVAETQQQIEEIQEGVKLTVQPLPADEPPQYVYYSADGYRSPFMPESVYTLIRTSKNVGRPYVNPNRKKGALEQYSLNDINMLGVVKKDGRTSALVVTQEGSIIRVHLGDYIGLNNGRIIKIQPDAILVGEVRPNGVGGFVQYTQTINIKDTGLPQEDDYTSTRNAQRLQGQVPEDVQRLNNAMNQPAQRSSNYQQGTQYVPQQNQSVAQPR